VRAHEIVFIPKVLDDHTGLGERPELLPVEALVAEAAVEGFDEAILPRAARIDVDGLDLVLGQPALEFLGNKLRAVVGADVFGGAVQGDGAADQLNDIGRSQCPVGPKHVALPGVLVEDREHPDGAAPYGCVGDKVPGPHVVAVGRLGRQAR